jgi:hypothetical protein
MNIKKMFAELLKRISQYMITAAPASASSIGIEEMPESMKKLR